MEFISSEYEIVNFVFSVMPIFCAFDSMNITFLMNKFDLDIFNARGAIAIDAKTNFGFDNFRA